MPTESFLGNDQFGDGGFAQYYYLPPGHYVFKVSDPLTDEAVLPVNCACARCSTGSSSPALRTGDRVVIKGAGGLRIFAAAVAAEKGASKVISIDGQTPRLEPAL